MTEPVGPDRLFKDKYVNKELPHNRPVDSSEPLEEDIDNSQEADDLEQEPDEKRNRAQQPEPPHTERVGPGYTEPVGPGEDS